jgi:hypothetical protein
MYDQSIDVEIIRGKCTMVRVLGVALVIMLAYYIYSYSHRPHYINVSTSPTYIEAANDVVLIDIPDTEETYTEAEYMERYLEDIRKQREDV